MADSNGGNVLATRTKVLAVVKSHARAMTVVEIAGQLEIHPNTVRFHLDSLIERGQVEQVHVAADRPGRPAVHVKAVAAMDPAGPRQYRVLAEMLTHGIAGSSGGAETALQAGRAWGSSVAASQQSSSVDGEPASQLNEVLDDLGFAPEWIAPGEIGLRHCPFLELATSAQDVVCSVHLGMMQGVLEDSEISVDGLTPFLRPDLCVAHLRLPAAGEVATGD